MSEPGNSEPVSILVVDDDEIVRMIMRDQLEAEGYRVTEAVDGLEGWEICSSLLPDLVIADVMMPRMDGFTLCHELRYEPRTKYVPILLATGLDDLASIEKAYQAGATDFICKPLDWNILKHRVRYLLAASRAMDQLRRNEASLIA